jgi:arylsulfatase A-like enzyme
MLQTGKSWQHVSKQGRGESETSLAKMMSRAGYETWHCGKGNNEYSPGLKAFDTNLIMDDHTPDLRRGSSERHADAAIKFLQERKTERPFYIYLAPPVPHDPRVTAPEFHHMYAAKDVPLPASFLPQHPFDNGEMAVRDEKLAPWPRTPEDTKQQLADYYACVTGLDHHIGRIFEQLKKSGQLENTIIIFTGDNGLSLGEHGLFGKQNLYEFGGMHVPFVIAGPGIPKGKSDALVYLMDLFPTFAEIGGTTPPKDIDGKSLMPVINGTQPKVRDLLYTGYRNCQRAVRDERWKLIRYPLVNITQLFDLQNDPHELTNLAEKPEHATKVSEMMEKLQAEMKRNDDTHPLVVTNPSPAEWNHLTEKTGKKRKQKSK